MSATTPSIVKKANWPAFSSSGNDSAYDNMLDLRRELDNAKLAAVGFLTNEVTHNFGSLVDGAGESKDVPVPGCLLGDFAFAACDISTQGMIMHAAVSADGVVTVRLQNETAGTINLASCQLKVAVLPKGRATAIGLYGEATFDPATDFDDAETEETTVTVTGARLGDYAVASFSLDNTDIIINAAVTADDTVSVVFQNESAVSNLDLSSGTLRAFVLPAAPVLGNIALGAKLHNFASLNDGAGESVDVNVPGALLGDMCTPALSIDVAGMLLTAHMKVDGVATVRLQNESTGTVNLAECVVSVAAIPPMAIVKRQFVVE